jgi:hypothetical protein
MRKVHDASTRAIVVALALLAGACSKNEAPTAPATTAAAPAGNFLKVDAYCSAFCGKLCGTCGDASCAGACKPRCHHGRDPDLAMDGKDPKIALALTQKELDACLAAITAESCPKIIAGEVPPACFTVQH